MKYLEIINKNIMKCLEMEKKTFVFGQNIAVSASNTTYVQNLQSTRDVYAGTSSARGLILTAPNGTQYRVTVDNSGNLVTTSI